MLLQKICTHCLLHKEVIGKPDNNIDEFKTIFFELFSKFMKKAKKCNREDYFFSVSLFFLVFTKHIIHLPFFCAASGFCFLYGI